MKVFGRRDTEQAEAGIIAAIPELMPPRQIVLVKADQMITNLRARVLKQIDPAAVSDLTLPVLRRQLEQVIHEIANEERYELSGREQARLAEELTQDMMGYGPIEPLLRDEDVTDIMVNAPDLVYVERYGKLELSDVQFRDSDHIAGLAQKIASRVGRRIDESSPMVDARLHDGSRVNIVFPPLSIDSPCISIRKFSRRRLGLTEMVENGTMTTGVARMLGIAARARLNVLIAGGTGSGKTMLLNAMSNMIDSGERIISIEDAAELQLQQRHVIRLETRPANLEGNGQVTQRDLLHNALRMRPDRIIVGEVRGTEAFDMLQAMNTGHDGSMCTIHANSARESLTRVENMVQMGQFHLPLRAIRQQILSAIDLIVHVERMYDGIRRVTQITDVCNLEGDVITTNDIAVFDFEREDTQGRILGHYRAYPVRPSFQTRLDYYGLSRAWTTAGQEV
ncbi:MAG TPA: CpaF family protein [Rhodopila sp.]|jgi:pilus assembly protein CpaF